jgi:hypothetical protein
MRTWLVKKLIQIALYKSGNKLDYIRREEDDFTAYYRIGLRLQKGRYVHRTLVKLTRIWRLRHESMDSWGRDDKQPEDSLASAKAILRKEQYTRWH